ncbi:S41 family peptidase [Ekhidna sp. To15]|uniref:S41 family peptidase n=1 Tax=Ekhidna sp. To15 TaxID=3395267 RepID=UPI003F522890
MLKLWKVTILLVFVPMLSCAQQPDANQETFNELWTLLDERYSLFEARDIDWQAVKAKYEPQLSDIDTDQELFDLCCRMISELNDGHTSLIDTEADERCNSYTLSNTPAILAAFESKEAFWEVSDATLLANGFNKPTPIDEHVFYSSNERFGYIRLNLMAGTYRGFAKALELARDKEGMILDIRLNPGGNDETLHRIAGRLVDESYISHYKETRIAGTDQYTSLRSWKVKPEGPFQYLKPTILLTSDFTASASDVFTLSLKGRSNVTIAGTRTMGAMSHVASDRLKNGWRINYSNKRTYSRDMVLYEGKGIPPDVFVESTDTTKDQVILKAMELLQD